MWVKHIKNFSNLHEIESIQVHFKMNLSLFNIDFRGIANYINIERKGLYNFKMSDLQKNIIKYVLTLEGFLLTSGDRTRLRKAT